LWSKTTSIEADEAPGTALFKVRKKLRSQVLNIIVVAYNT